MESLLEKPNGLYYIAGVFLVVLAYRLDTVGRIVNTMVENRKEQLVTPSPIVQGPMTNGRLTTALELIGREQKISGLAMLALETAHERIQQQERLIHDLERRLVVAEAELVRYNEASKQSPTRERSLTNE